jgi:serine/threonine protein kinase
MAPELIERKGFYNGALSDMWAAGVVLYSLLTGGLPFKPRD